jgi:hypothetical protein
MNPKRARLGWVSMMPSSMFMSAARTRRVMKGDCEMMEVIGSRLGLYLRFSLRIEFWKDASGLVLLLGWRQHL